jgi:hypothetical protein
VESYVASGFKDQDAEKQIRMWLVLWSNNDGRLHPLLETSSLLQEDEAQSATLSAVASIGLQALDYLDKSQPSPNSWKTQQLTLIEQAKKPSADVLLMIVAPVQQLIEASSAQRN